MNVDAAEGIIRAAERYDGAEPINLGSGREITIREPAELIGLGYFGHLAHVAHTSVVNENCKRARTDTAFLNQPEDRADVAGVDLDRHATSSGAVPQADRNVTGAGGEIEDA